MFSRSLLYAISLSLSAAYAPPLAAQQKPASVDAVRVAALSEDAETLQPTMKLPVGKAKLVRLPINANDVIVADEEIADIIVRTPRLIYLVGRKIGATNIFVMGEDNQEVARFELNVQNDTFGVTSTLRELIPNANIDVKAVDKNLFLTGKVRSAAISENARQIALRFVESEQNVVNLLTIVEDQQVLLKVRISEVSRTSLKEVGINIRDAFNATLNAYSKQNVLLNFASATPASQNPFFVSTLNFTRGANDILNLTLSALEQTGLIKNLAEPNLTAISGETANFLVGGEFPVPVAAEDNQITVEFKAFGVNLNFTPVVLNAGRISVRISTEVSSLSNNGAVTLANITIPALSVRRAETTVELPSGGSVILAGLIQDNLQTTIQGVPGLKDVPVLGSLFRTNTLQKQETELLVAVTAYLVNPLQGEKIVAPTDLVPPPSDYDLYLFGRVQGDYEQGQPNVDRETPRGPIGYIVN